ncbi:MFS transporter [Candidatus Gottesmanbacteria bacterium]|nr:MFS transporter [Candidatus Gottesmanbacteria bacterium]
MKKTLWIIALIAVVNALGYGIIIPILYSYSHKFGLSDFHNGLLFSIFSVFQFVATPLIGRLSDAYGRRPLLLISLFGTALSFFIMAFAQNAAWLFIARALDGLTAGNIPVALAVISDTTEPKDRAKGFGIIGASFGLGFTFGPAISAFTIHLGAGVPFIIAGFVALAAFLVTAVFLQETNTHKGVAVTRHVFDFRHLFHALVDPAIGKTLTVSFLVMLAFSIYIYAFQPMSVVVLHLSAQQISIIFTVIGIIGLVSQGAVIPRALKLFGERRLLVGSALSSVILFLVLFAARSYPLFLAAVMLQAFTNGFANPVIQALLSREADQKSQGSIMGVNASYQSIGQIIGPIIGGVLSTIFIPLPFLASAAAMGVAALLSVQILRKHLHQQALV